MMERYNENIVDEIRDKVDIVRWIGEFVPLKKTGQNFKGLCPFHKEKTPSFLVHPEKQIFKCFGCGESGNVFGFVMKYEGLTFPEAVRRLADYANIQIPESDPSTQMKRTRREELTRIMSLAHQAYQQALQDPLLGEPARRYLTRRGFDKSHFISFGFGYAPDAWNYLTQILPPKSVSLTDMEDAGLIVRGSSGGFYDRFRNRVIFPIRDHREGKIVAFGGRTLGDDPAKYLNTPETPVYHKSRILYGLRESMGDIRSARRVIVVEGYFDRLSLVKAGVRNVVAPCGTSLTSEQARLLRQYADRIILLFDADPAGITASMRALEVCLKSGVDTYACVLPEGKDPDVYIQTHSKEDFYQMLESGVQAIDFLIEHASSRHDVSTPRGRKELLAELTPFLMDVENPLDQGMYINRLAARLSVTETSIMESLRQRKPRRPLLESTSGDNLPVKEFRPIELRELNLLQLLLARPHLSTRLLETMDVNWISHKDLRDTIALILDMQQKGIPVEAAALIDRLEDESIRRIIVDFVCDPGSMERIIKQDEAKSLADMAADFRRQFLKNRLDQIRRQIISYQDEKRDVTDLLKEQMDIARQLMDHSA